MANATLNTVERPIDSTERVMADDPLAQEDILAQFYRNKPAPSSLSLPAKPKPEHYKVLCISFYKEDIDKLNHCVAELKRRGHTKANKSQVLRAALEQFNPDLVRNTR